MKKLTDKMIAFCEQYIANGFNGSKAYQVAYGQKNKDISSGEAHKLLQDQRIQDKLKEIQGTYELVGLKVGINRTLIMQKVKSLLEAKKPIYFQGIKMDDIDDTQAINAGITTFAKLTGGFEPERTVVKIEEDEVDVTKLSDKEKEELRARLIKEL